MRTTDHTEIIADRMEKVSAGIIGILAASETGTVRDGDGCAMRSISAIIGHGNPFENLGVAYTKGVGTHCSVLPPIARDAKRVDRCGTKHISRTDRQILEPIVKTPAGSV